MSSRLYDLSARIQDVCVEGSFTTDELAAVCGELLGHAIRQLSAGTNLNQPATLEKNLNLSRALVEEHARKNCMCAPERPNCDDCGHPNFRHALQVNLDLGKCTVSGCICEG